MPNHLTRQRRRKRLIDQTSKVEEETPNEPLQVEVNNQSEEIAATEALSREEGGQEDQSLQRLLRELKIGREAQITVEDSKNQAKKKTLAMIISQAQIKQRAIRNKRENENAENQAKKKALAMIISEAQIKQRGNLSDKPTLNKFVSPAPPKKNCGSGLFQIATPSPDSPSNRSTLRESETTELNTDAVPPEHHDYVGRAREDCENPYMVREQDNSIYAIEDRDAEEYVQKAAEIEGKTREMNVGTESEAAALKRGIKDLERVMSNTARLIGEKRARLHEIKSERKKAKASLGKK
ncbi:hypothetical protein BGAL_0114g00030 [Botrytis galanthina]|uniref:Uncharacterized protein n=1 Tax=Botrytis galanthina TaxID=278940 RepID=A0A4S8R2U4_9HELO|nr:hypothetical protein BGAL_0114g00030 [Botrytis galanthina]